MTEKNQEFNQKPRLLPVANFVNSLFEPYPIAKGFVTRLRREGNPTAEYQSWEIFVKFQVDLDKLFERIPLFLVALSIAKSRKNKKDTLKLSRVLAWVFDKGVKNGQASLHLRCLFACPNIEELYRVLQPLLSLIQSRVAGALGFAVRHKALCYFKADSQQVKPRWANQFYQKKQPSQIAEGQL